MADPEFEKALARAKSLVTQGKLDEAAGLYEQLLAHDPQYLELYRDLALIYERTGDIPKAINTHIRWAAICDSMGMHDDALKLYNQVLAVETAASSPDKKGLFKNTAAPPEKIRELIAQYRPEISLQMGRIFLQKQMADEAIKNLKGALDSQAGAQDHRVHTLLGIAYMQKNMDKEAIGEFQEVVRLAPNEAAFAYEKLGEIFYRAGKPTASTIVWFRNAGDLYLRNEQFQDAIRAYETILKFESRNKDVLNRLAEIYMQQGMQDQALATYRTLAQIYTEEGLLDKVIILYEKLTDINPEDNESWGRLLDIYRSILQRDASNLSVRLKLIKHLTMRGEMDTVVPEYLALANAYLEKGVLDEAWQVLQKMLEFDPRNPKAREILGDIHIRRDERAEALKAYLDVLKIYTDAGDEEQRLDLNQKLMTLFPEESGVQYELARSLKDQGSYNEALSEIMKVLEQDPNHVQALSEASDLLMQMGRAEEACDLLNRILAVDPKRTDARMKLFEYYLATGDVNAATDQVETVADALREKGLLREAEMVYRRMLNYYPDSPEIRLQICELRMQQGDIDRVLREYLLLATMFTRRKLLERAAEMYDNILSHRPDLLSAHHSLARVLAQQGQKTRALGHFAYLAQEYLRRNLGAQALGVLHESVDVEPTNVGLRQRLVELLVRQLRIEDATEQYKLLIRTHLENGRIEEAAAAVKECVSLQPLHLDMRLELATMYLEFNHLEQGQALLEELVSAYLVKGQTSRVIDIYDKMAHVYRLQERHDLYWQAREKTAELYREEGRNAEALAEYQEIVEGALRAGDADRARTIFSRLADLYFSEQRAEDAIRAFERLVEGFGRDGQTEQANLAQEFLVQLLERKGDEGGALQLLLRMAVRAQESDDTQLALSLFGRVFDLLVAGGDLDEAATTQFIRIRMLLKSREIESARALFETLRGLRPDAADDASRQADLLYEHGFHEDALPLYVDVVAREPANVEAKTRLAVIHARQGDMAMAASLARTVLAVGLLDRILREVSLSETSGDDGILPLRFGAFYEEMGFYEEALSQYQRAARSDHRLEAMNRMAFLFRRVNYIDLAIRQFTRTLEQPGYDDEELLETRYNLASLYYQEGRYQEALSMFNECSAVRLRYRDVAERIEELSRLIASGTASRAEVIPFAVAREETDAPPDDELPPAQEVDPAAFAPVAEDPEEALAEVAVPEAAVPEAAAAEAAAAEVAAAEGAARAEEALTPPAAPVLEGGDDDFFLEGPPPDPTMA